MRVYDASTCILAEFGGIRDLSRHLSLNFFVVSRLKTTAYLFRGIERAHVPLPVLILHLV